MTKGGPVKIVHPLEISGCRSRVREREMMSSRVLTSPVLNSEEKELGSSQLIGAVVGIAE